MKLKSLNGKKFNKLLVLDEFIRKNGKIYWKCKCDCGNITYVYSSKLKNGSTKSCGCYRTSGLARTHGDSAASFYNSWRHLKERCNNSNCKSYKNYGERGIKYDLRWKKYKNYKNDMYWKYVYAKKKYRNVLTKNNLLSIERINNDGNYCFENCEFIPMNKQNKNTRRNKWFIASNNTLKESFLSNNQMDFGKLCNLNQSKISKCLHNKKPQYKGWTFEYICGDK